MLAALHISFFVIIYYTFYILLHTFFKIYFLTIIVNTLEGKHLHSQKKTKEKRLADYSVIQNITEAQ